jgi:hypothetical protein
MFGKSPKDKNRHKRLVDRLHTSSLNLSFATPAFINYHHKVKDYIADTVAHSTADQYFLAFNRYSAFCVENGFPALPADKEVISAYFVYLAEDKQSLSAVYMARAAIRHYSLIYQPDIMSPTDNVDVCHVVRSIKRRLSKPVKKAEPTTKSIIILLITSLLQGDQLKDHSFDKPIDVWQVVVKTVFKFYSFARFEEILELKKSHFNFLESGDVEITIPKAKNNQFHDARTVYIAKSNDDFCPVNLFVKYFLMIGSDIDHYFVPRISYGLVYLLEKTCYPYCLTKFREALLSIGVENFMDFGEHSDKVGGLSAAANAGCDIYELQTHGRLASDHIPKLYHKRSLSLKQRVSQVLNRL